MVKDLKEVRELWRRAAFQAERTTVQRPYSGNVFAMFEDLQGSQ